MKLNHTQCNPGLGASVLYDLIYKPPTKLVVIGGCSIVSSTVAETAKLYNLVVLAYGASSPALSNRKRFPTFFRTHPSATVHNPTRVQIFKMFGWTRISIILEAEEVFVTTAKDLEDKCREAGIEVATRVTFLTDAADAVRSLNRSDSRIIVGIFYGVSARKVMCEAYKKRMFGKQHVWFLIGWYEDNWYLPVTEKDCTEQEMLTVLEGHLTTEAVQLNQDSRITVNGETARQWLERYHRILNSDTSSGIRWIVPKRVREKNSDSNSTDVEDESSYTCPKNQCRYPQGYVEASLAYDTIWAVALALNKTIAKLSEKNIQIESFDYQNE